MKGYYPRYLSLIKKLGFKHIGVFILKKICKKCHKEFHDKYGYGNNTVEQFEEFLKYKYDNTEVK